MGAKITVLEVHQVGGELIGDLRVQSSAVTGGVIEGAMTAALIDEIPALAVLGAASTNGLTVRDAGELRVKETDRIATIEAGFKQMGVEIETNPEGFHVPGRPAVFMPLRSIRPGTIASLWRSRWPRWQPTDRASLKAQNRRACLFPNFSLHCDRSSVHRSLN